MKRWRYFDLATGLFTENTFASNHDEPPALPGRGVREDVEGWRALRVEGDELVPHRPPAPSSDHEWSEEFGGYRLNEAAASRMRARVGAQLRIAELEARQPRALREAALGDDGARARLRDLDEAIAEQRRIIQENA